MENKRDWQRTTEYTVNTGARIPIGLYNAMQKYMDQTGKTKTEIICTALRWYLDDVGEGGAEE